MIETAMYQVTSSPDFGPVREPVKSLHWMVRCSRCGKSDAIPVGNDISEVARADRAFRSAHVCCEAVA